MAIPAAVLSVLVTANTGGASASLTRLDRRLKGTAAQSEAMSARVTKAAKYAGVGIAAGVAGSIYAAAKFESAFAEVEKTVNASSKGYNRLEKGIRGLALHIPESVNSLAQLAGEAGALGIKNRQLVKFTKTAAELGTTTNLSSEEAATGLARLANIMDKKSGKAFERAGATLVDLGNKGASTEDEILEMSLRIAGAGKTIGLTESEVEGLAASLANVGTRAEAGGSSVSRILLQMQEAVAENGAELEKFAAIAGVSGEEFAKAFESNAPQAIAMVAEGLGKLNKEGKPVLSTLKGVNLGNVRVSETLLKIAGNTGQFTQAQGIANKAWEKNSALTKEAHKRYVTLESQLKLLKNAVIEGGIAFGQEMVPDVKKLVHVLNNPHLTFDEKVDYAVKLANKALSNGITLMAEESAEHGPEVALAFVRGFLNADIWGKLAIAGFLVTKLGGKAALAKTGTSLGEMMGTPAGRAFSFSFVEGATIGLAALQPTIAKLIRDEIKEPAQDAIEGVFGSDIGGFITGAQNLIGKNFPAMFPGGGMIREEFGGKNPFEITPPKTDQAEDKLHDFTKNVGKEAKRTARNFRGYLKPLPHDAALTGSGINQAFLPKLDHLADKGGDKSDRFAANVGGSFQGLSATVQAALENINTNIQTALRSLNVAKVPRFTLKAMRNSLPSVNSPAVQGLLDEKWGGGAITKPMAIVGEEAPQHHEWVIATNPKYRSANVGYWMQAGRDLGMPGFAKGGKLGPEPHMSGPDPMRALGQQAISKVYEGAQSFLKKQAPAGGFGAAASGQWRKAVEEISANRHWNAGDWISLIMGESGGDPTATNPSSGAFGIGQFLGSTLQAYRKYGAGSHDPVKQVEAMAHYIADRYTNPTNAYQKWLSRSPHWYAKGGLIGKANAGMQRLWSGVGPSGLQSGIRNVAAYVMDQYPGLSVSSTTGGTHADNSLHYTGQAVDLSKLGDTAYMNEAAAWIRSSGLYKTLAEGIHNPNLSISEGHGVSSSYWGAATWADHLDHIHLGVTHPWSKANATASGKGPTEGEQKAAAGKARKQNYERQLAKLKQNVAGAKTLPAKQSALWHLVKFWGRSGIFDKGERGDFLGLVQEASSKGSLKGTVGVLSRLANFAGNHGEITGRDPDNWHSMNDAIERAQKRGQKVRERIAKKQERARNRRIARIAAKGEFKGLGRMLERSEGAFNLASQGAERLVALEPENLTDAYVGGERGAWAAALGKLGSWRDSTIFARNTAVTKQQVLEGEIQQIQELKGTKAYQKQKWRLAPLREAVGHAKEFISAQKDSIIGFQGYGGPQTMLGNIGEDSPWWLTLGGPGASIFDTQNTIRELALKVGAAGGGDDNASERAAALEELLRQANQRADVSDLQRVALEGWDQMRQGFAGFFAKGGNIGANQWGVVGENGPEIAHGPVGIMPMTGGSTAPNVNIEQIVVHSDGSATVRHEGREFEANVERIVKRKAPQAPGVGRQFPSLVHRP
jgi:TP901 family phage tail tape measure protein